MLGRVASVIRRYLRRIKMKEARESREYLGRNVPGSGRNGAKTLRWKSTGMLEKRQGSSR